MATQKQVEKLELAYELNWITLEQYKRAMSNAKYCYELTGEVMLKARMGITKCELSKVVARDKEIYD